MVGDAASEHVRYTPAGLPIIFENSITTTWNPEYSWGHRLEFGSVHGDRGWIGSVCWGKHRQTISAAGAQMVFNDPNSLMSGYADGNGDGYDDDLNSNTIYGRNGRDLGTPDTTTPGAFLPPFDGIPDTPAPVDTGDIVYWQARFTSLEVVTTTEVCGADLMNLYRFGAPAPDGIIDCYFGARYLRVRDTSGLGGSGGFLDATTIDTRADNDVIGPQIGARWTQRYGWMTLVADGRFLAGYNLQTTRQSGRIATNADFGGQNEPANLTPFAFEYLQHGSAFSPVGEWRLETVFHINPYLALRLGYTGMVMGGMNRSGARVFYSLPDFGLTAGSQETMVSTAFTLGVEFNR
jgi:hypothetical protein